MLAACEESFPSVDIAVMCAAVADYAPAEVADRKIKREHSEVPVIHLVMIPDIAATLGSRMRPGQILVGLALETDHELDNAAEKLRRKNLDMIVLNSLRDKGAGFGTDTNKVSIIRRDGSREDFGLKPKREVAADIVSSVIGLTEQQ